MIDRNKSEKRDVLSLDRSQGIYFIGIGGIGMSALAIIFHNLGYTVAGSDAVSSEVTDDLVRFGIQVDLNHEEKPLGYEIAVYSTAISADNPQLEFFQKNGKCCIHRSILLAQLMKQYPSIGVTGTHGKTTTSALTAFLAEKSSFSPMALIGGYMKNYNSNAIFGNNELIVAEVDESDKSHLEFSPSVTVITNIEQDHMEHYQGLDDMLSTFSKYLAGLEDGATLVYYADDPYLPNLINQTDRNLNLISFGFHSEADYFASTMKREQQAMSFDLAIRGKKIGRVTLPLVGEHNVLNLLASFAALEKFQPDYDALVSFVSEFQGVGRRMDRLYDQQDLIVVDDYAHHPTEIKKVIDCLRAEGRRLVVVYEPHRYTRTKHLFEDFLTCFEGVDFLVMTDIYAASENEIPGISSEAVIKKIQEKNASSSVYIPKALLVNELQRYVEEGDLLAFLGAGDISNLAKKYLSLHKKD